MEIDDENGCIDFVIKDKLGSLPFSLQYDSKSRAYIFIIDENNSELEFIEKKLGGKKFGNYKNLTVVLGKIIGMYKKKNGVGKKVKMKKKRKGIAISSTEKMLKSRKTVNKKTHKDYLKTWSGIKSKAKLPAITNRDIVRSLVETKNFINQQLVQYLKQNIEVIHIRPKTSFFWEIEIMPERFKTKIKECLEIIKMNVIVEVRYPKRYPIFSPTVRIIQPRFRLNQSVSKGGLFECDLKSKTLQGFVEKLVAKINTFDIDVFNPSQFYDDMMGKIDFRRKALYKKSAFPTINKFTASYSVNSPILYYSGSYNQSKVEEIECGNKIVMPMAAAKDIFQRNPHAKLPLLFEIKSKKNKVFCGVSEFSIPKKTCVIPYWMMKALKVDEGEMVRIRCVSLKSCTFVQMMPLDPNFFKNVDNPKTLLEATLLKYLTLTVGDTIPIRYGKEKYDIYVLDLKPADACSIIATKGGFLELKLDVVPPINFDPKLHKRTFETTQDIEKEMKLKVQEEELKSPVKLKGVRYVKCENCGHSVKELTYKLHVKHCKKTYYRCDKCNKMYKIEDKEAHESEFHEMATCTKCLIKIEKFKLKYHEKKECIERMAKCKYFGCPVVAKELVAHERKCGSKTEKCQKCGKYVYMSEVDAHQVSCFYGKTTSDPYYRPRRKEVGLGRGDITPSLRGVSDMDIQIAKVLEQSYLDGLKGKKEEIKKEEIDAVNYEEKVKEKEEKKEKDDIDASKFGVEKSEGLDEVLEMYKRTGIDKIDLKIPKRKENYSSYGKYSGFSKYDYEMAKAIENSLKNDKEGEEDKLEVKEEEENEEEKKSPIGRMHKPKFTKFISPSVVDDFDDFELPPKIKNLSKKYERSKYTYKKPSYVDEDEQLALALEMSIQEQKKKEEKKNGENNTEKKVEEINIPLNEKIEKLERERKIFENKGKFDPNLSEDVLEEVIEKKYNLLEEIDNSSFLDSKDDVLEIKNDHKHFEELVEDDDLDISYDDVKPKIGNIYDRLYKRREEIRKTEESIKKSENELFGKKKGLFCPLCYIGIKEESEFVMHLLDKHGDYEDGNNVHCPFCGLDFKNFRNHVFLKHLKK